MYGHLNLIIKRFFEEKFRDVTCQAILKKAGCPKEIDAHKRYDDAVTERLIDAAAESLCFPRDTLLQMVGEFYTEYLRNSGHDELLRNLGENMLDFLQNLDYIHTYMMGEYPDAFMPSFRCETDSQKDRMTLHYYSFRTELQSLVIGILNTVARIYFNSTLEIKVVSKTQENVGSPLGMRNHVVYSITVVKSSGVSNKDAPPTFVAQTKKHGEKQIHKTDIDHVMERLDEIRREQGEGALPLNKNKVLQGKWKALAKMSILHGGFVPLYPKSISFDPETFCNAFPYHVVYNDSMTVVQSGIKIQQLMPSIRISGAKIHDFFDLLHPSSMTFSFHNVKKFINTPFVLKTRATKMTLDWGQKPMVILRGQMVNIKSNNQVIYLSSPFVRCLGDLEERDMHIADIPIHDVTRDMLWQELMDRYRKTMDKNTGTNGRRCPVIVHNMPLQHLNPDDPEVLRAELQRAHALLAEERERYAKLHLAFLPPTVAGQILSGQQPEAGTHRDVTVLFSDVVAFSTIMASCSPHELVDLLTRLHREFNVICRVNSVYRVEAVADAYMVVSGVADNLSTHAERIANTALGMLLAAREVTSPYDYGDKAKHVRIRVGVHSGKVLSGVVGDELPRHLVMGEAVNIASKMESHGMRDKIHISQATRSLLKKNFKVEKRGSIDIRGFGKMTTYFLVSNTQLSSNQLLGRPVNSNIRGNEVTFINEGQREDPPPYSGSSTGSRSPFLSSNKVSPAGGTPSSDDEVIEIAYSDAPRKPLLKPLTSQNVLYPTSPRSTAK